MKAKSTPEAFFELANRYPSPHNGQPIQLKRIDDDSYTAYFARERGLQSTEISFIFSFVSIGVFMRHLELAAAALGHELSYKLTLPGAEQLRGEGPVEFAALKFDWNVRPADTGIRRALEFRQTSRKKYSAGLPEALAKSLTTMMGTRGFALRQLDQQQARQAVWLNQRAVFDDMFDEPVRRELDHWLRYNQEHKQATRDGLAYDCMEINGAAMKQIVHHPGILRWPGVSALLRHIYLSTMTDASSVFYMLAPFSTERNAYDVGLGVMDVWMEIARQGYYLHPFGTIMSNHAAHKDFLEVAGVTNETREHSYLVFIFRAGRSGTPTPSLRIPYQKHLVTEQS